MSDFSVGNLQSLVMAAADHQIIAAAEDYATMLKDYIQYEYNISNMELAQSWKQHGYEFKMMPESFIRHINISPVAVDGRRYSLNVVIEPESFKEEPVEKYNFFKQYVINNAMQKIRARLGTR